MTKFLLPLLLLLTLINPCSAGTNSFLSIKLGMNVNTFNRFKLTETRIPRQKQVKQRSSQGVFYASTATQSKFFKMKSPLWQHGMIKLKDNIIQQFSVFAKKTSNEKANKAFLKLSDTFGSSFSTHPFKSFGKSGVSFEWQVNDQIYAMSYVPEKQGRCSYHLDVSLVTKTSLNKPFLALNSQEVTSVFLALGIEQNSHQDTLASKSEPLDDELSGLFE
jgi:hypothetical protein